MTTPCSRFLLGTAVDQAQISASSQVDTLPVGNLQDQQRTKLWRATGCAQEYVDIDLGRVKSLTALALIQHNLSYDGVITLQAGSAPGTSDLMDQAYPAWEPLFGLGEGGLGQYGLGGYLTPEQVRTFFPAGTLRIIYFHEVRARYWRLLLEDADNPDGYLQAGRVILDFYRQSSRMVASGMKITAQDPSKVSYSKGGQAWRDARTKYRTGTYRYQYIPENQTYGLFFAMLQELGVGVSFVADFFHGDSQVSRRLHNQLYCHIPAGALPPLENLTPNYGHVTLTVRESR